MGRHVRLSPKAREDVRRALALEYANGKSIRDLADAHVISYGFVYRLLHEAGTEMRSRGGARFRQPSDRRPEGN